MKKILVLLSLSGVMLIENAIGQDDAGMKAWQDYKTPGTPHKMMAAASGEWNEVITMWTNPSAPPETYTATAISEMVMDGRYQLSNITGTMMGMPFKGMSLMGYDNAKKIFTSTWVDNFGTGTMTLEGKWDEATKSIELAGKAVDPMTGKDMVTKEIMKFIDNDTQELQIFNVINGKDIKSVEIKSTRKK